MTASIGIRTMAWLLTLGVITSGAFAQEVTFSGFGAAGMRWFDRNRLTEYNEEYYYEGKLQADIEFSKHIEAQLDIRGVSADKSVKFREFSARFKYMKKLRFKFGNIKKPFGIEQMTDRDEYHTVDDGYIHRKISELGYGGRNIGLQAYYNYSSKRQDFPYSYYAGLFRNNSFTTSAFGRFSYHFDETSCTLGYALQKRAFEDEITSHGFTADITYSGKRFSSSLEAVFAQDPDEGLRRRLLMKNESVFAAGIQSVSAVKFDIDGKVIKDIEPVLLLGLFTQDAQEINGHSLQVLAGVNFYLHKQVRFRLNLDGILTTTEQSSEYSTHGSRVTAELFAHF